MTNSIVPIKQAINLQTWQVIQQIAPAMYASRMFQMASPEQAAAIMLTGYELGLSLTASFRFLYYFNGQVVLRPKGALALIRQSGLLEKYEWHYDDQEKKMYVTMGRKGEDHQCLSLSLEAAQKAGWKSKAWETAPENMLRWRLTGWLADLLFTDILGGLYTAGPDIIDITPEGDIIEIDSTNNLSDALNQAKVNTPELQSKTPIILNGPAIPTIEQLSERFSFEKIMEVSGGIPADSDALYMAALKLGWYDQNEIPF